MKLEVGKYYRTRSGEKAYVGWVIPDNPFRTARQRYPFAGYISGSISDYCWCENGSFDLSLDDHNHDLVAEWREAVEVSGWVNVYLHPDGGLEASEILWPTKELAAHDMRSTTWVATVYVSGAEGEGP